MGGEGPTARRARLGEDPSDMLGRVLAFPDQLREALALAREGPDLLDGAQPACLHVIGMGGSAIGGDFLRAWAARTTPVPVEVVRGYELPRSVDAGSFAIFVSYSGDTEETLAAWEEAERRGVPRACVTSGGELADRARAAGVPCLRIPAGSPPRAALGWTSVPLFHALGRAGLAPFEPDAVEEAAAACERILDSSGPSSGGTPPVRAWAEEAVRGLPVIHAPSARLAPVATRWACQLNENAKLLAHAALFPEHNHNEVVGWEVPTDVNRAVSAVFLEDDRVHPRVRRRMDLFARAVEEAGGTVSRFSPEGDGLPARLYSLALLGDLASLYAAAARGVDPTPVASIDRLKSELAREPHQR